MSLDSGTLRQQRLDGFLRSICAAEAKAKRMFEYMRRIAAEDEIGHIRAELLLKTYFPHLR